MSQKRLVRWCLPKRPARFGASEAALFFLCLRRAAGAATTVVFVFHVGWVVRGFCWHKLSFRHASAGRGCARYFSRRNQDGTPELVAAADARSHGAAERQASGSDGRHLQSSKSRCGTHAGHGRRRVSFDLAEVGSGPEVRHGRVQNQYADRGDLL